MPHLSDSQLDMYLGCPEQWRTKYMDPEYDAEPSDALILGKAFHDTLEKDGNHRIKNRNVGFTFSELKKTFAKSLEAALVEGDPENRLTNHWSTMEERGFAMLEAFIVGVVNDKEHLYRPLVMEDPFDFDIPGLPRVDPETYLPIPDDVLAENPLAGEAWTFVGRIDARVLTTDPKTGRNVVAIWDWKTASKPWGKKSDGKPWSKNDEDGKTQATAYIMSDFFMGRDVAEEVTFVTFPTKLVRGKWTCEVDKRTTRRVIADGNAYLKSIRMAAREIMAIRQGVRQAIPRAYWKCRFCHNLGNCYEGVQYHQSKGIALPPHLRLSPEIQEYLAEGA